MALKILFILPIALCLFVFVSGQAKDVSQACLGCICDAASGCDTKSECSGEVCGPFRITRYYWSDGGKPTLDGESDTDADAFSHCASDAQCAARAVEGYMKKYAQDCNGDGEINCDDYARLHNLGGFGCTGALNQEYEDTYNTCRKVFP